MKEIGLNDPADLRKPYEIDMGQLLAGVDALMSRPDASTQPGVQMVDPRVEQMADQVADMVTNAVVAAAAAQSTKGATPTTVRAAAREATRSFGQAT